MNFYKHYIGDFQRDTGHLSLTERGAYRSLLDHHYATEKPLPDDLQALCRVVGAVSKAERDAVAKVVKEFWTLTDDGYINARAMREMGKAAHQREANRHVAEERWAKRKQCEPSTNRTANRSTNADTKSVLSQTPDSRQASKLATEDVAAKGASLVALGNSCLEAIGHDPARFAGSYSGLQGLVNQGFTAEQIVVTAKRLGERPGFSPPRNPVAWLVKVLPGEIGSQAEPAPQPPPMSHDERMEYRLRRFKEIGLWSETYGPKPDNPYGLKPDGMSDELLAKYGYLKTTEAA